MDLKDKIAFNIINPLLKYLRTKKNLGIRITDKNN